MIYIVATGLSVFFAFFAELFKVREKTVSGNDILSLILRPLKVRVQMPRRGVSWRSVKVSFRAFVSVSFAVLSALPLTFISAFRYYVGTDFDTYWVMYLRKGMKAGKSVEPGYTFLVRFLRHFSTNPQLFFIVSSIIICGIYFGVMYKESECFPISVFLFVVTKEYFRQMNGIRQYLAVACLLIALVYLKKDRLVPVSIFSILACMFHYSAVIIVMFVILCKMNFKPTHLLYFSAITLVLANVLKRFLFPIINRFTNFGTYFERSSQYSDSHFEKLTFLSFIPLIMISICVFMDNKEINRKDYLFFTNGVFLGLFFYALSSAFPTTINRLGWYSNLFVTLYFPNAVKLMRLQVLRWVASVVILLFFGVWSFPS